MANKIVPQTLNSSGIYDKLITAISSGGTGAESESAAMKNLINGLSSTTPNFNDLIPFQDISSGGAGKTTLSALASTLQSVRGYAKIQTGSYVGTGTYGADNPCSLTFDFEPKYIMMILKSSSPDQFENDVTTFIGDLDIYNDGDTLIFSDMVNDTVREYDVNGYLKLSNNRKTIQWYCDVTYKHQTVDPSEWSDVLVRAVLHKLRNSSGITYPYYALA